MISSENIPNLPGWLDLGSPDQAASAAFYRQVFGWTAENVMEDENGSYSMFSKDGKVVAGLGGLEDPSAKSEWMTYVRVNDAEGVVKAAEALGAKVRVPFMDVPPTGGFAQLTDASGAEFALWQPGEFAGFQLCCEDDSMLWAELWTRDPAAAKHIYGELFGWKTDPFVDSEGTYDMWSTNPGVGTDAFGGIMPIADGLPIQDEKWIPYFMVADADDTVARTVAAGGSVLMPAADTPPGRLAALADPFGARFNLLKPAPM
jgi:uncharacterized protein